MSQSYKDIVQSQLPYKVYKSNDIESRVLGRVLDGIQDSTNKLELNVSPQTMLKEGIKLWEDFFNLLVNQNDSLELRRNRVLAELIQYMGDENVITKEQMESILALYGNNPEILEYPSEYYFLINYNNIDNLDMSRVNKVIQSIKPAYLDYFISYTKPELLILNEEYFKLRAKYRLSNRTRTDSEKVHSNVSNINILEEYLAIKSKYRLSNRTKTRSVLTDIDSKDITVYEEYKANKFKYKLAGKYVCGR